MYSLKYLATVPTAVITVVRGLCVAEWRIWGTRGRGGGGGAGVAAWLAMLWWGRGGFAIPTCCVPFWWGLCTAVAMNGCTACSGIMVDLRSRCLGRRVGGACARRVGVVIAGLSCGMESQEIGVAVAAPGLSMVNQHGVGMEWWQDVGVSVGVAVLQQFLR
ncbi:hypothetical protein EDB89DRAFT_1913289 [Lactarius sanguifluus]|nr:hypothetical protein EDB89DRAFT_1913289 [Lactarius sanguifluus]